MLFDRVRPLSMRVRYHDGLLGCRDEWAREEARYQMHHSIDVSEVLTVGREYALPRLGMRMIRRGVSDMYREFALARCRAVVYTLARTAHASGSAGGCNPWDEHVRLAYHLETMAVARLPLDRRLRYKVMALDEDYHE